MPEPIWTEADMYCPNTGRKITLCACPECTERMGRLETPKDRAVSGGVWDWERDWLTFFFLLFLILAGLCWWEGDLQDASILACAALVMALIGLVILPQIRRNRK